MRYSLNSFFTVIAINMSLDSFYYKVIYKLIWQFLII